jgi:hypothetical protein
MFKRQYPEQQQQHYWFALCVSELFRVLLRHPPQSPIVTKSSTTKEPKEERV